jgi:glycine/D-amino acid oxidase-like deaminating enzyme
MARPEVTVMGAGVFGLACAWAFARRGARVAVVDPGGIGAGASGGLVGALAPHAPDRWSAAQAFQFRALIAAPDWWAAVAAAGGGDPGYARVGRLMPLADAAATARAAAREAAAAVRWGGAGAWRVIPAPAGLAPRTPTGLVAHDTLAARLHPRRALAALAAAVAAAGGALLADPPPGPPAGPVIWATGAAGLAALSAALGREVGRGEKGQALLLAFDAAGAPLIGDDGLWVVPHDDGTVAVGSTAERDWTEPGPDAALAAVQARAVALLPALAGAPVLDRWAGIRPRSATRLPMLGRWPGRPGHWIANGGFRTGFALAPALAEALADHLLEGRDSIPPEFSLPESAPPESAPPESAPQPLAGAGERPSLAPGTHPRAGSQAPDACT